MGNVWEAIKRHQQEQAEHGASAQQGPATTGVPILDTHPATSPNPPQVDTPEAGGQERLLADIKPSDSIAPMLPAHFDRGGQLAEEFRSLRTTLLAQTEDERFCLMVTSADRGEGKTITTINLGIILAEFIDRVTLIVDFDLHKARLGGLLKASRDEGIAEVIRGERILKDVIRPTTYPNLYMISTGRCDAQSAGELFARGNLEAVFDDIRRQFDFILVDTPPMNLKSDAGSLGRAVDQALLVVRMNKTRKESVDRAIGLLHAANIEIAGMVLSQRKYYIPRYVYEYS